MKGILNLGNLNEAETLTLNSTIISDLPGNATFTPKPTLAALSAPLNAAEG